MEKSQWSSSWLFLSFLIILFCSGCHSKAKSINIKCSLTFLDLCVIIPLCSPASNASEDSHFCSLFKRKNCLLLVHWNVFLTKILSQKAHSAENLNLNIYSLYQNEKRKWRGQHSSHNLMFEAYDSISITETCFVLYCWSDRFLYGILFLMFRYRLLSKL